MYEDNLNRIIQLVSPIDKECCDNAAIVEYVEKCRVSQCFL